MNYHYFDNGAEKPRGFVRITLVINPDLSGYGYAPEIIGEFAREDCGINDPSGLSCRIKNSLEEANNEINCWAQRKGYRLQKLD